MKVEESDGAVGVTECGLVGCRRKRGRSADGKNPNAPQRAAPSRSIDLRLPETTSRERPSRVKPATRSLGDPSGLTARVARVGIPDGDHRGGGCIVPLTGWPVAKVRPSGAKATSAVMDVSGSIAYGPRGACVWASKSSVVAESAAAARGEGLAIAAERESAERAAARRTSQPARLSQSAVQLVAACQRR